MTLVSVQGGLWLPGPHCLGNNNPTLSSLLMDAAAEKVALIFRCPKAGTLDKFEFRTGNSTQPPSNGLKVSFQDVDPATGDPDGTADQFRVVTGISANTWTVPGLITSDGTDTGTKRTVAKGDLIACVIEFQSFVASDSVNIAGLAVGTSPQSVYGGFPYADQFTAVWAKQSDGFAIGLKYDDGTYGWVPNNYPFTALNNVAFNSGSTPDERGLKFRIPFPARLSSVLVRLDPDNACDLVVYDSDGTSVLATVAIDPDIRGAANNANIQVPLPSPVSLLASTFYRIVLKPGASSINMPDMDANSAALLDGMDGGQDFHYTQRTNAGAWTDTTAKRPWMWLQFDQVDDGAGAASNNGGVTQLNQGLN